jgi:hypothetical protein
MQLLEEDTLIGWMSATRLHHGCNGRTVVAMDCVCR